MTFLTPLGFVVALAALVPLAALAAGERRVRSVRAALRLRPPPDTDLATSALALAAVCLLLGIAAAQPAVRSVESARVRTDAEALFVLDTSRSMAAVRAVGEPTRLARAQDIAQRLRAAIPEVPAGAATLTDRLLPNLLPSPDLRTFNSTVVRAIGVERPPPRGSEVLATTFAPLGEAATGGYFSPDSRLRALVVLTDGESRPFSVNAVGRALRRGPGISLVLVQLWHPEERIYGPGGRLEDAYRPNERSRDVLESLASAADARVYAEDDTAAAADGLRRTFGTGPTEERGRMQTTTPLGPYVAAAALLPLLFVLRRRNLGPFGIRLPLPARRLGSSG